MTGPYQPPFVIIKNDNSHDVSEIEKQLDSARTKTNFSIWQNDDVEIIEPKTINCSSDYWGSELSYKEVYYYHNFLYHTNTIYTPDNYCESYLLKVWEFFCKKREIDLFYRRMYPILKPPEIKTLNKSLKSIRPDFIIIDEAKDIDVDKILDNNNKIILDLLGVDDK